jgi:hypothetical protein
LSLPQRGTLTRFLKKIARFEAFVARPTEGGSLKHLAHTSLTQMLAIFLVMAGLDPAIHVFVSKAK